MLERLFDERFREAAAGVRAYAPVRLMFCVAVAGFIGVGLGWLYGLLWALAALLGEAAMLVATRAVVRADSPLRANWICAGVYLLAVPVWTCAGILLWSAPDVACQVSAVAFFGGHLLYLQSHHGHSPGAALPALPAVLAPVFVPFAIPHFTGLDQFVVCLTMAAAVTNALISMYVSLNKGLALQRAQAAMLTSSQAKSEFLARMSHEIRTPLNGVLGMTQALDNAGDLSAGHRESLAVIRQSGESLLAILNDILDISKVEAGRLELEQIAFDVNAAVQGVSDAFAPQAHAKGLGFSLDVDPSAAGHFVGDPTRVRQILYNLLSNAVKFTETGEIRLTVAERAQGLQIEVADTGIGIAPAHLSRLFGRFQQVDSSTTRRYGGSGLGLSIVRELAELMGGSVAVDSIPGSGTRFTVVLPLPRAAAPEPAQGLEPGDLAAGMEQASATLRVLAAEDNPVNQLVVKTLLGQVGIVPVVVSDGAQAVEAWRSGGFDLVLMDVQMPVMDGLAATGQIRAAEAAQGRPRTPILALTADAMSHQVAAYMAAGFDGHVAKPIDAGRLYEAIAQAALGEPDTAAAVA